MESPNEIPPGGEGKVKVTVRTSNYSRQFRQTAKLTTNDPEHPGIELVVTANVHIDLEAIPLLLKFEPDQGQIAQVQLKNYTDVPVQLSDITSSHKYVKVSVSSTEIPANGAVIVTAELLPDVPKGILSGWVTLRSNLKSMPIFQIRVWGNIE